MRYTGRSARLPSAAMAERSPWAPRARTAQPPSLSTAAHTRLLDPMPCRRTHRLTADVAFAPDGRTFATGEPRQRDQPPAARDDRFQGRSHRQRTAQTGPIAGGRLTGYTRDGRFLLVVSGERRSLLLDGRTLKRFRTFPVGGAAALSPSADEAAFGHADGTVTLLELGSGKRKQLSGQSTAPIETISFSRDGKMLASGAADGSVGLWRVRTGLSETLDGHSASVRAAVFSPDGRTLYTASYDGSVIAWDLSGSRRLGQPFRYADKVRSAGSAVSPDGTLFAVSPGPNRVTLWHCANRTPIAPELHGPAGEVNRLAFSPDGRFRRSGRKPARRSLEYEDSDRQGLAGRSRPARGRVQPRRPHRGDRGHRGDRDSLRHQDREATADFLGSWKHPGPRLQPGRKAARLGEPGRHCEHLGRCQTTTRRCVGRRNRARLPFGSRRTGSSSLSATAPGRSFSGTSPRASMMGYRSSATATASPPWTSTRTGLDW